MKIISDMFEPYDGPWRGLGAIPGGSLRLKKQYQDYDALHRFGIEEIPAEELGGCQCGRVLCGLIDPPQCPLFAKNAQRIRLSALYGQHGRGLFGMVQIRTINKVESQHRI